MIQRLSVTLEPGPGWLKDNDRVRQLKVEIQCDGVKHVHTELCLDSDFESWCDQLFEKAKYLIKAEIEAYNMNILAAPPDTSDSRVDSNYVGP